MIQRDIPTDGSNPTLTNINNDVSALVDEINKGTDPSTIPTGSVVAEQLRLSQLGVPSNAYVTGFSGGVPVQIPGNGGVGSVLIGVNSNTIDTGVGGGTYFLVTPYVDLFVDPVGSGPSLIGNIYASNTPEGANIFTHKCCVMPYLQNSGPSGSTRMFNLVIQVFNFDTVSHWLYVTFDIEALNTSLTKGQ